MKRGVLAAAAGAVQAERAIGGACPATRTDFGVDLRHLRSDASSGAGSSKSPFWNKHFESFSNVSKRQRDKAGKFLTSYKHTQRSGASVPKPLKDVEHICWLEPPPVGAPRFSSIVEGQKKCLWADLVITGDIFKLGDVQTLSDSSQLVVDVINIIARGKPVITATSWVVAKGQWRAVPARDVMRHIPLATRGDRVRFQYTGGFDNTYPTVVKAIKSACKITNSHWRCEQTPDGVKTLQELATRLVDLRRVENSRSAKAWTAAGPTVV